MKTDTYVTVNGKRIPIEGERNLLELIRKGGIEIPTFCYHSELSVYGACRLCLVEVEGWGLVASCSTPPMPGMVVRTHTEEIREIRKISVELLLANNHHDCPTCPKSGACQLQGLARRLGIDKVRFNAAMPEQPVDHSSMSLLRDPNKCILCGDCVRACEEIQGIGAIDFAYRGAKSQVLPAFGKNLDQVECVNCGLCARVCPTGAITPRPEVDEVFKALEDPDKIVVAQIAPAVRVALGECFGLQPGAITTGQIVAALKMMGFDQVYDTCFAADLTVLEEANEFLVRKQEGKNLPQFTSCCPAWIRFAEQYASDLLSHLSSCRSPQQMFGSLAKDMLPEQLNTVRKNLYVVSIMPCVAKKSEARRAEFTTEGVRDVDAVLTTQELARMIEEAGLRFHDLQPESLDLPLGFKTGAGVIFGATGGVSEAVLRYASEKITGRKLENVEFHEVRGQEGLREATMNLDGTVLKLAVVHGLANARLVIEKIRAGTCDYDFIEVMACPGGCVGGAGQPVAHDAEVRRQRARGLYEADKMLQLHKSQDNHMVCRCYREHLGDIGGHKAHELLHTGYETRRRIAGNELSLMTGTEDDKVQVRVCVGTNCHVRGSQDILRKLIQHVEKRGLADVVDVQATFCLERCDQSPNVAVGDTIVSRATYEKVCQTLESELEKRLTRTG